MKQIVRVQKKTRLTLYLYLGKGNKIRNKKILMKLNVLKSSNKMTCEIAIEKRK